jgi:hypothetical protein
MFKKISLLIVLSLAIAKCETTSPTDGWTLIHNPSF